MLKKTIPSYLYLQYQDDKDIQAFVDAFNVLVQEYIDSFNSIILPISTSAQITGYLLDWVAMGLYGISRPSFGIYKDIYYGTLNTWNCNTTSLNQHVVVLPSTVNDDIFKRIITWHFYKEDAFVFNILWLKRRIERFLFGSNGSDYNGNEDRYRISVSFLDLNTVIIRIINKFLNVSTGSLPNFFGCNQLKPLNTIAFSISTLPKIPLADMLKRGIDSGFLELPFQFEYVVINE